MRNPYELEHGELAAIVSTLQREMYLEMDPKEVFIWNPDKELDCRELIEGLDQLISQSQLHPAWVEIRSKFIHRPEEGVEFEEEESSTMSGPPRFRNPELAIPVGQLIGHLSPNFRLTDIVFAKTLTGLRLLNREDVEALREVCDRLLEFMKP